MKTRIVNEAAMAAERALVGWAFIEHSRGTDRRAGDLDIEEDKFLDPRWRSAWATILRMEAAGERIDEITVADAAQRTSGFPVDLATLAQAGLEPSMLPESHAAIVREAWVTRQVLSACSRVTAENEHDGLAGGELLSFALRELAAVTTEQPEQAKTIGQMARERFVELGRLLEAKKRGESAVTGIPTGLPELDAIIGGWQRGIVTVVAARPGMGKSAFMQLAADHASSVGAGVHGFNMEDAESAYTDRAFSRLSGVPADAIRSLDLRGGHLGPLGNAAQDLYDRRGWLMDNRGGITAEEVVRAVRRSLRTNKTQLAIVDYAQLLRGAPRTDRTEAAAHAMDVLADAAKQDGIAYLVGAQLNRACEQREDKRPQLGDLKQSGALEERAKAVLCLYRPAYYHERNPETGQLYPEDRMEILIRKQNHGPVGRVLASWNGPTTRIG